MRLASRSVSRYPSRVRRATLLCLLQACGVDLEVPARASLSCDSDAQCPEGWSCVLDVHRCVKDDATDRDGPGLQGGASVTPPRAGAGTELQVLFAVDSPLLVAPRATLELSTGAVELVPTNSDAGYGFRYRVTGDEPEETAAVVAHLVDPSGNRSTPSLGEVTLDFTGPSVVDLVFEPPHDTDLLVNGGDIITFSARSEPDVTPATVTLLDEDGAALADLLGFLVATDVADGTQLRGVVPLAALALGGATALSIDVELDDTVGNRTPAGSARTPTLLLDLVAPTVSVTAGPLPVSVDQHPVIDFTADEAGVTYACALDGAAFSSCTPPLSLGVTAPLSLGSHTLVVRATDAAGNVGPELSPPFAWEVTRVWAQVDAGDTHTCAVATDHTLWCWGDATQGQLGTGTTVDASTALQEVTRSTDWTRVSVGTESPREHSCGLKRDGTLWCWGSNFYGQLGVPEQAMAPLPVGDAGDWIDVAAGGGYTCGVRHDGVAGSLWCWGNNNGSRLGLGAALRDVHQAVPMRLGTGGDWRAVFAGRQHACALDAGGAAACWGVNTFGQLGSGSGLVNDPIPVTGGHAWTTLAVGGTHTCGIQTDGSLWCWGSGAFGQTSLPGNFSTPQQVGAATDWEDVAAGEVHTCARHGDALTCFGQNRLGELGRGAFDEGSPVPTDVALGGPVVAVSGKRQHTCALLAGGSVQCWGNNRAGQLGGGRDGRDQHVPQPAAVQGGWVQVAGAIGHLCGIRDDGVGHRTLWCWGDGVNGRVGAGSFASQPAPVQITDFDDWSRVATGNNHSCAIRAGTLYCFGVAAAGQLGTGSIEPSDVPVISGATVGASDDWVEVSAGASHTCGIRDDAGARTLWCFGQNADGELGRDSIGGSFDTPAEVAGGHDDWAVLAAGQNHTCAIRDTAGDRTLWCWGNGNTGQLGDGVVSAHALDVPTQVGADTNWLAVASGGFPGSAHTCAVRTDNTLTCFGQNGNGELGIGTTSAPVAALTPVDGDDWLAVGGASFAALSCGLRAADGGSIWCAGDAFYGELAAGQQVSTSTSFRRVAWPGPWSAVAQAAHTVCGIRSGELLCWGSNASGMLGDGAALSAVPVNVPPP